MTQLTRILWIDYGGIPRCKAVPTSRLGLNIKAVRSGMVLGMAGGISEGVTGEPVGEVTLLPPDVTSDTIISGGWRRILVPWHPTHQIVFAEMYETNGEPFIHCPRRCLRTAIGLLGQYNLRPLAGFELEFALVKEGGEKGTATLFGDQGTLVYASAQMLDIAADVVDEMVNMINMMGINVTLVHAECGRGQYEIVLDYCDVMQAVENVIVAREAVKAVARKHALRATFAPVYGGGLGNGGHVHISLEGHFGTDDVLPAAMDGKDFKIGVDKVGQQFMAGIVEALPWLMFACNPSPLSYKRIVPGAWCGVFKTWGFNNKEAPVRLVDDRSNVEVKFGDAISNAFHAVAAILTAGAIGIRDKLELSPPCQIDPQHADDKSLYPPLPVKIEDAMELFRKAAQNDDALAAVFPEKVVQDWIAVRMEELKFLSQEGEERYEKVVQTIF